MTVEDLRMRSGGSAAQASGQYLAELRDALADADIPVLLMVLVQLTGDRRWLHEPYRPSRTAKPFGDPTGGLPELRQEEVRDAAFAVVADQMARSISPPLPDSELLIEMMGACVGESVPAEYEPLIREEMGWHSRDVLWRHRPSPEVLDEFHVVIIGAGVSGLCAAIHLDKLGIRYTVIEKNPRVGGTWYENSYPGCRVDVPNHFYSYSFEPNPGWPSYYSDRNVLHRYLEDCARKYRVDERIRFSTEVESAAYSADDQSWMVNLRAADGQTEQLRANVVVSAVGQLNRPHIPALEGLEEFDGLAFHSARWRHDIDLEGQRVAVLGTGASAMQFAPSIAAGVKHLTIFQRSPQWAIPNEDYHRDVSDQRRWLFVNVPFYAGWYRFSLFWRLGDGLLPTLRVDPEWSQLPRTINARNERVRQFLTAHLLEEIGDRPDLVAKALPDYPPYSKRILIDNHWFKMLRRANVELVTEPIARVHERSIETSDGAQHPVDVIVFGTGFQATKLLWPMSIRGRSNRQLSDVWGADDARAYLGIAVPEFPNFFCLYGPNTNLGHGGSIIFHAECQTRFITHCIRDMLEGDYGAMECRPKAYREYNRNLDAELAELIWSQVDVGSWYKNSKARVVTNSPWRLVDYWAMTSNPNFRDWIMEPTRRRRRGTHSRSTAI
jgi:4-hydroxyacetophenone monooxygenase